MQTKSQTTSTVSDALQLRAEELFQQSQHRRYLAADRIFMGLMLVQWLVAIILAFTVSPYTWLAEERAVHEHVLMAFVIGGVLTAVPWFFAHRYKGSVLSRHMIAISQVCWSAFLIHLTGGRIETHFHVFGSLAFLAFYRDWKILLTATIVVALDHALRGIFWPQSVFGIATASPFRWIEHAAWVVFEDVFLMIALIKGRRMAFELCYSQAQMEHSHRGELDLLYRAMANASCGILISDANTTELPLTYVNETFEKITGYSREEILGKSCRILQKDDRDQDGIQELRQAIKERRACQVLLKNYRKDGEFFWNELSIAPVHDEDGELTHFLGIQNDVTEREKTFQAIEESRKQLAKANVLLEEEITEKNKAEKDKERLNKELIDASRQAGMAEIATGVLHNVGNVMNSINISAESLFEKLTNSHLAKLGKVVELVSEPGSSISNALNSDEKGKMLPEYLTRLLSSLEKERDDSLEETKSMKANISHVAEIVAMQQTYARLGGVAEEVSLEDLCNDAIRINDAGLVRHGVDLELDFNDLPKIVTEKHKVLQILVNFVSNAKYAVSASTKTDKRISMKTYQDDPEFVIAEVTDNGVGISKDAQLKIFQHGFTTKSDGHGFGLHSSINAAREIGGDVSFESNGTEEGACFRLKLPLQLSKSKTSVLPVGDLANSLIPNPGVPTS